MLLFIFDNNPSVVAKKQVIIYLTSCINVFCMHFHTLFRKSSDIYHLNVQGQACGIFD